MEEGKKTVTIRMILEIMGAPKEHVMETLNMAMNKIKEEKGVEILKSETVEPNEVEVAGGKLFSTFAEIEMKVEGQGKLLGICFDYMPSSIEVLDESKVSVPVEEYNDFLNDLLTKLHKYDMLVKNIHAENQVLKMELGKLTKVDSPQQESKT